MQRRIIVLGAGMVGVSCAWSLLRRGHTVSLVDRKPPGRETSFGNSGVFSRSSVFPINGPSLIRKLPGYALNQHPAVRWRASLLSRPLWLAGFLREATAESVARRSTALDGLIRFSMDLNRQRMAEAGLTARLRETGWLKVWRAQAGMYAAEAEARALAGFGIATNVLDADGVARLEPDAAGAFHAGLLIVGSASVDDPGAVVAGYAQAFAREGGRLVEDDVRAILSTSTGWRVASSNSALDADVVVIALGPWSGDLLLQIGVSVPMFFERGYHVHLIGRDGKGPRRAVYDVDGGYVISPMAAGVRVTTGVELARRDAPPRTVQIDAAAALARRTFGLGEPLPSQPWLGARPTLPDSLPMIGPIPGHHGLYAAFGHQHIGFSTGAATGEIVAAMIEGVPPPVDPQPFLPSRYL